MDVEQQLREDLSRAGDGAPPGPPADLADVVLRRHRRRGRARTAGGALALAAAVAIGVPAVHALRPGVQEAPPAGPALPRPDLGRVETAGIDLPTPGGGARVIEVLRAGDAAPALLDPRTGRYLRWPGIDAITVSPDGRRVAVSTGWRTGVADRTALIDDGASAVRWLELPPGSGPAWSPDGRALLFTSLEKGDGTIAFTAHRYDLAEGRITSTPVPGPLLGSSVGWAADSRRYVALLRGESTADTVEPGPLRYLEPGGGRTDVRVTGGAAGWVGGAESYTPDRRHALLDTSDLMSERHPRSTVIDVRTHRVVATIPDGARPLGFHDDASVVWWRADGDGSPVLEIVAFATGEVVRRIPVPGLAVLRAAQLGDSGVLGPDAAHLGF